MSDKSKLVGFSHSSTFNIDDIKLATHSSIRTAELFRV